MLRLRRSLPTRQALSALCVASLLISGPGSQAATIFWTGGTSNTWGAANWENAATGGAPIAFTNGDDVIFSVDAGGANLGTTLGANRTINSLTVNANVGGPLSIGGNRLTIAGGGMNLSAAGANPVTITSDITVSADQTWVLTAGQTLTVDNDIDGTARTLTIDGSGGATLDMGQTTNNASDLGFLNLTNGTTFITTADNQFNDYRTVIDIDGTSTYNRNNQGDALSGVTGSGSIINFSGGTINRELDLRPRTGAVNVFTGTLDTDFRDYQQTAGYDQRNLVTGQQAFDAVLAPDRNFEIFNGQLRLFGTNGQLFDTTGTRIDAFIVGRADVATSDSLAEVILDSSTANQTSQDRLPDAELLNMRTGSALTVIGNNATLTTETIGTFELERSNSIDGRYLITLDDTGAGVQLTSASLTRSTGSSILFRGEGLGTGAASAGITNLIFTAAPTLTSNGSGSGTGVGILPYAIGDNDPTGLGTDFVTYDTNGVRLLTGGEYAATITSGANVALSATPAALGANADLLALKLGNGAAVDVDLGGFTLDVQNAGILSVGSAANSITNGTLTFGSETEGFLHVLQDLNLSATIADNGAATSLTKSGAGTLTIDTAQTYTGNTSVTEGSLVLVGNDLLRTNRMNLEGTLDLSNAATTMTNVGMLGGTARATVELGDNTLEISGGFGNTSFFGGLNGGAGSKLIKSGGNTFSLRSDHNVADAGRRGTFDGAVEITGGTFEIRDVQGRLTNAASFDIFNGAQLELDSNLSGNSQNTNDRIGNDVDITLHRGTLTARGSNNARYDEDVGDIILETGFNIINLDADFGSNTASNTSHGDVRITADSIQRNDRSILRLRGDNLGFAIGGTADNSGGSATVTGGWTGDPSGAESNLRLDDTTGLLSHAETDGTNVGIVPWMYGATTVANVGQNDDGVTFVTYGGNTLRFLDVSPTTPHFDYNDIAASATIAQADIADENLLLDFTANNADATLDADTTIRALLMRNTGGTGSDFNLGGNVLNVESGAILSSGTQDNQILGGAGSALTFGNNASTSYEGNLRGTRTLYVDVPITDNGGNAVSVNLNGNVRLRGNNTFTGDVYVHGGGRNYVQIANGSTDRIPDTSKVVITQGALLAVLGSGGMTVETIGGLEGQGILENYNNSAANDSTVIIDNANDHVFEGRIQDGRAGDFFLVKDGVGSQTLTGDLTSTYTGTTELREGTLVLGGGLTNRIPDAAAFTFGNSIDNTSGTLVLGDSRGALDQTLMDVTSVGTGTSNAIVGGNAALSSLTLNQTINGSLAGNLGGTTGDQGQLSFTKGGAGEFEVTGTTNLLGNLAVTQGSLTLTGDASVGGTVDVAAGTILNVDGSTALGSSTGIITVGDGAALNFRNGNATQQFSGSGNVLALDGTGGSTILGFGLDGDVANTNDQILLGSGQTLSTLGTILADIYVSSVPQDGEQFVLIDAADDGAFTGGGSFNIGAIFNGGSNIYDVIREGTASDPDQLILTVTAINIPSAPDSWWDGDINTFWGALGTGGNSNWNNSEAGGVDAQVPPDETSIVHFSTTTAGNFATVLDASTTIEALIFHANSGTNGVSIGANTNEVLTIGNSLADAAFLDVLTGGNDAIEISAGIALGKDQSWNIEDGTSVLTVSGGISGSGNLTVNDNGTATGQLLLAGSTASTFTGSLNVEAGSLAFQDTASLSSANDVQLGTGTMAATLQVGTAAATGNATIGGLTNGTFAGSAVIGGNASNSTLAFGPTAGTSTFSGAIGGVGANDNNLNLVKDGAGIQILDGSIHYTFANSGSIAVQEGTLQFGSSLVLPTDDFDPGVGVDIRPVPISYSVIAEAGATANLDINGLDVHTTGTTTLGGLDGSATAQISDTAGTGLITLGGAISYNATNNPLGATISADIDLGGASRTFTANDSSNAATDLTFDGDITDPDGANTDLTLAGGGQGLINGVVDIVDGDDIIVNAIGGTWTVTNATSTIDDIQLNDGTLIVETGGQLMAARGDDIFIGNDNDTNPAALILNAANAFVGDDLQVRGGSTVTLGIDGALVDADGTAGMDVLNIGGGSFVAPVSTVEMAGHTSSVTNFVLGSLVNNAAFGTIPLLEGALLDNSAGSTGTLTIAANSTARFGTISANITGGANLFKEWDATVTLQGENTYTGRTDVRGGQLILDYSNATGIGTEDSRLPSTQLRMGRDNWDDAPGRLTLQGSSTVAVTETVGNVLFTSGGNTMEIVSNGQDTTLAMGTVTADDSRATANFILPVDGGFTTTTADTARIGGWAVVNGQRFAQISSGSIIEGAAVTQNDVTMWASGEDIVNDGTFVGTIDCGIDIATLTFDAAAASDVSIGGGSLDITTGGILVTADVGANTSTISGRSLTTSGGQNTLYIHQHNTAGELEISANLRGGNTISKSGEGTLVLSGTRNDLGTVRLHEGTLRVTGGDALSDNARLYVMSGANTVFELAAGQTETVGSLAGGVNGTGSILINAGSTLTVNQTANDSLAVSLDGSGTLVKEGGGNLNYRGAGSMTGELVVNRSLFQISNVGRLQSLSGVTINRGSFLLDNNSGTRSNNRLGNSMPITLNSADGGWSGSEQFPRGLSIRTDQNAATNEDFGVLNIASGASYVTMFASGGNNSREVQLIADNFVRTTGATLNVRGTALGSVNTVRTTQLRINNATNQTAFLGTLIGGGTGAGSVTRSIAPWAIGEGPATANPTAGTMGNSFLSYIAGRGFSALDLATDYSTFAGAGGATDNVRESLTTDLTGLVSQTVNALVLNNDNTAASTLNFTGTGAGGQILTNTSGGFLFTLNTAAAADSLHTTTLGGFDGGIATAQSEYVFHVVNPSANNDTAQLTAQIDSALTSSADIVKSGRGTLVLSQVNTAGGGANRTVINEGAIQITDLDGIGGDSGIVHLAGGALQLGAGFADDLGLRTWEVNIGGGGIDTNSVDATATDFTLSGAGAFTKTGLGTLGFAGTASLTQGGEFIVQQGVVELGSSSSNAFGANGIAIRPIAMGGATVTLRNTAAEQIDDGAVLKLFNVGGGPGIPSGSRYETGAFTETIGGLELTSASGSATRVTIDAGGMLVVNGDIVLNNNRGGSGTNSSMVEIVGDGTLDLGGASRIIEVASTATADGTDADIEAIVANGGIVKEGEHILYLKNGANTYAGGTEINEGTVSISEAGNLGADTGGNTITLRNGGTLQSTGTAVSFGVNRAITLDGSGGTIEVSGAATNSLQVNSVISGHDCGPLTKTGDGALVLSLGNTYEGGTNLSAGSILAINTSGSATGTGAVTTAASTVLGGNGFIAPGADQDVNVGGTLTVGIPTVDTMGSSLSISTAGTGSLILGAGSTTSFDLWSGAGLGDNTANTAAADLLTLGGSAGITLGGTLQVLDPNSLIGWAIGDSWRLFDWTGLTTTNGGLLPGDSGNEFDSLDLPDLSGFALGWDTSNLYTAGTIVVVPEPSRVGLLFLGLLTLLRRRRRG